MMRKFIALLVLAALVVGVSAEKRKPNILFIITDDQFEEQYGFLDEFDWKINDEHQLGAKIWMQAADRNLPPSMDKNVS